MTAVTRLVTSVEVDDPAAETIAVSARHEAELADGSRVLLLDDRGWSSSGTWATATAELMRETARVVVGPDLPVAGRTWEDAAAAHWATLSRTAARDGVLVDGAELRRLPHDVVLSRRVRALVHGTAQTWSTRAEAGDDAAAVRAVELAAFDTSAEADLVDALRADPAWIPGLSVVACDASGTPMAHALLTRCHIGPVAALCLAPCAVLPEHQRTGAGSAAIRAALAAARERGERYVTVLGHPTYYPRFGFVRASQHGIHIALDVPDEALMALALDPAHALPGGPIRYAAPFGI